MIRIIQDLRLINNEDELGDQLVQKYDIGDGTTEFLAIDQSGMPDTVEICVWRERDGDNVFQSNRSFEKHEVELMIDYLTMLYNKMP